MLKHNLLIAYRGFLRNKSTFLINLVGLSTGLACALLIYLWVADELSINQFHEHDDQLYQVMSNFHRPQGISTSGASPIRLASALAEEIPEVETATLVNSRYFPVGNIASDERELKARRLFTDEQFFNVFSFELLQGDKNQVLDDIANIILSDQLAQKLFGTTDGVVGKRVVWRNAYFESDFLVSGIFEAPPANSTYQFDVVLHYDWVIQGDPPSGQWNAASAENFVLLKKGTDVDAFNSKIEEFLWTKDPEVKTWTLFAEKFSRLYLHNNYENGVAVGGRISYVRIFSIIGIFILLIACINFMNLSTAQASKKMKEIGVKKAVGADRLALMKQFLIESSLLAFLAFLLALVMVSLVLPQFIEVTGKTIQLDFEIAPALSMLSIVVLTGLIAGSYPAFFLSGFNAITVLKGKRNTLLGEQAVRNGLVVFQFALSVIFIVGVSVVSLQMDYVQTKNLGFDRENIISFYRLRYDENPDAFMHAVNELPGVEQAATMVSSILSGRDAQGGYSWTGEASERKWLFRAPQVGYGAIETLGLTVLEGRDFSREFQDDHTKIVINESAAKKMGLESPVGTSIRYGTTYREIIGVVSDFHYGSLHRKIEPLIFRFPDWGWGTNTIVKIKPSNKEATIAQIAELYHQFHPEADDSFNFTFLDDEYQQLYESEQRVSVLSRYFGLFAIIVSCLGLFGLATFNTEQRIKEIGVRKILGSSVWGIVKLLSTDFTKMVLGAIVLALPISYLLAQYWLESFAYQIELTWPFFAGSALLTLILAWTVVGIQTFKAAGMNPVYCLQHE